jgi:hypothetical protein
MKVLKINNLPLGTPLMNSSAQSLTLTQTLSDRVFPSAVSSVSDWFTEWKPQMGLRHWQDGKSAKELAKAWFPRDRGAEVPPGFLSLMRSSPVTSGLTIQSVTGEVKIPLDKGRARARHADLVLKCEAHNTPILIHIEAKCDEEFAQTCEDRWESALRKEGPDSALPNRMSRLCHLLFGTRDFARSLENVPPRLRVLRYQLLYGAAGAILDAARQKVGVVVFIVHELLPRDMSKPFLRDDGTARRLLDRKQVEENALDFQRFVGALTRDRVTQLPIGKLLDVGEFIPSVSDWLHLTETTEVRLLIGKAFDVTQQI